MVRFPTFFFNPNVSFAMFATHIEESEAGEKSGFRTFVFALQ